MYELIPRMCNAERLYALHTGYGCLMSGSLVGLNVGQPFLLAPKTGEM